ncbi:MAG: hypothetical protein Q7S45_02530 [Candidatus Curtissbacteria bacterium]|nr:hypothetical protein [Candidatus Curtissbacteria bacterium]
MKKLAAVFLLVIFFGASIIATPLQAGHNLPGSPYKNPDPVRAPYGDPLFTTQLTKVTMKPIEKKLEGFGSNGRYSEAQQVTLAHTFDIPVNFAEVSAIFAKSNSDYLEGKFQDQDHQNQNLVNSNSQKFNEFFGPSQKLMPKIMTDELKVEYINYVKDHENLPEYKTKITDIEGKNSKTVSDLVSQFGIPDSSKIGSDTWGKYWAKIPTAFSQPYSGFMVFRVVDGNKENDQILKQGTCPDNENNDSRMIDFVLPEYFRTAATANELNKIILPKAAQSAQKNFLKEAVSGVINNLSPFKDSAISKTLEKFLRRSFNNLNPVKIVYAQTSEEELPPELPPELLPYREQCHAPTEFQLKDNPGSGPFYSLPELSVLIPTHPPQLNPLVFTKRKNPQRTKDPVTGESCNNIDTPRKIDNGKFVNCTFKKIYERQLTIATPEDAQALGWDYCTEGKDLDGNPSGVSTCYLTVRVYPIFYVPWLSSIWNDTVYSDKNDPAIISGAQETGRPGIFGLFTSQGTENFIFPDGKNLPSLEDGSRDIKQRFIGAVDCNKEFIKNFALLPKALQGNGTSGCNLKTSNLPGTPGASGTLDFYVKYGDTSIIPKDPEAIKKLANSSWPDNNTNRWDYVVDKCASNGISPAFCIAIWWKEGGFGGLLPGGGRANSEFGCFPGGNTNLKVNFEDSLNCFVKFTAQEHPYNPQNPYGSFYDWVKYFCGPFSKGLCTHDDDVSKEHPNFLPVLESVYNSVAPGQIIFVSNPNPGNPGTTPVPIADELFNFKTGDKDWTAPEKAAMSQTAGVANKSAVWKTLVFAAGKINLRRGTTDPECPDTCSGLAQDPNTLLIRDPFFDHPSRTLSGQVFIMTHELAHIIQYRNPSILNQYKSSEAYKEFEDKGVIRSYFLCPNVKPGHFCANGVTAENEDYGEMAGNYVADRDSYLVDFPTEYPQHYKFAQDVLFGGTTF